MSHEIFQIVEELDQEDLQTQLALQCAPLLTGIKIANLLIVRNRNVKGVFGMFHGSRISVRVIYRSEEKTMFLLYQKEELEAYLQENEKTMRIFGYNEMDVEKICQELSKRYAVYMEERGSFPHEIGLLLGYPVEDVLGFIENEGKNYLYAGYWKVYGNVVETMALFESYNEAKEQLIRMISQGIEIRRILE